MHIPTHRALAVTMATGVSVAYAAPLSGAALILASAYATAGLSDRLEKIWFPITKKLHLGPHWRKHRENWTHWPTACIVVGFLLGLIVYGIWYGAAGGLAELMQPDHGHINKAGRVLIGHTLQGALLFGGLVAIGAIVGTVQHPLADACTKGGAPLAAPFTRRLMWLMPEAWRVSVGEPLYNPDGSRARDAEGRALRSREMTKGEKRWLRGAWVVTGLLVASQFIPELVTFIRALLDAIKAVQPTR